ncbi:uracil-DNA glycosylase family protein [Sphingomonas sp. KR1UV-12]|uniref:Uracil-DNA glycosylase family protein n=1 Tax=Sphingomonas aurea TaxID=3063994 RepID=A0ABT9EG20_9SPHN|nr:uracil-DNA glycosylase family protein [Sphingomonas sp. KR1UV-12]MDP1025917.1 uracil-DNA glycosylase family protein [Sphingomonas sp. KR1UV-12]
MTRTSFPVQPLVGDAIAERAARLREGHVVALEWLRVPLLAAGRRVPHFDPADGGDRARLLVLLETPGAGMAALSFVSRDNPTGTARNLGRFLDAAGITRAEMVLWNSVPWIVHAPGARNRPLRRGEIAEGLALLPDLLRLLPALRVVLLAGRVAREAAPVVARERPDATILTMPHPSPTYVCTSPAVPQRIGAAMAQARLALDN